VDLVIIGPFHIGAALRPADGFPDAGDALVALQRAGSLLLAVIDALGHGPDAHRAASLAQSLLEDSHTADPAILLSMLAEHLRGNLGAAVGIARIDLATGAGTFAGIGNTVARLLGTADTRLVSHDGVVGQSRVSPRPVAFSLTRGGALLMHSDGVSSRLSLDDYPNLIAEDPPHAARELLRRFAKPHDDAACLLVRHTP
jgi:serine phosphatase RsbU (regulator of sigma subunit)